jgi:hypothetical protein
MSYHTYTPAEENKEDCKFLVNRENFGGVHLHPNTAKRLSTLSRSKKQNTFEVVCRSIDSMVMP